MKHEHQHGEHEHQHQHGHASDQQEHEPTPGHDHDHTHDLSRTPSRSLALALALTASFLVVEAIVGWLSGSLALLSDAGHMLTDAGALALALAAQHLATRPRTPKNTYGLRRAEILAALLNGLVLGLSSVWIVIEAFHRWSKPAEIKGGWVLAVATVGLGMNLLAAWILSHGEKNTNVKAALAHVLADAAGSVAAMIAGALVYLAGWTRADAVVSILISLLILWGAWRLLKDSTRVLLEGTPARIDPANVEKTVRDTQGVVDLHDLHIWSISDGFPLLTVHVVISSQAHGVEVARLVRERLLAHGINHVTVQPEAAPPALLPPSALLTRKSEK